MNYALTRQQRLLLDFISQYIEDTKGVSPSFDEMRDAMGLRSKSGIHRLITGLEERGYIHRLPARARTLMVRDPCAPPTGDTRGALQAVLGDPWFRMLTPETRALVAGVCL